MKVLKICDSYKHCGYTLTISRREGNIIMAENPEYGFEVFRVKSRKEGMAASGSIIPEGEYPPANSDFGIDCQHFPTRFKHQANDTFKKMVERSQSNPQRLKSQLQA